MQNKICLNNKTISNTRERFLQFVSPEALTGCWLWTGSTRGKGYGGFRYQGKMYIASRIAYALFKGDPNGLVVCHHCNNPSCVNPDHLYLGTYSDNTKQAVRQKRQFLAKGDLCGMAKLSWEQVRNIRADPRPQRAIAKDYTISQLHVSRIKRNLVWVEDS